MPTVSQLLVNPTFDVTPAGTGWQQTLIDAAYPPITGDDGTVAPIFEHSAPFKVWLGGFVSVTGSVTDGVSQDVAIPPNTTQLVFTGQYDARTAESSTTTAYDTASLSVTDTSAAPIATILSLSNLTTRTGWTPINYTFTQNLSGQTIRLRMVSSNDFSNVSNFYFDTFALTATHGCP